MCIAIYPFLTPDSVSHASLSCIYTKGWGMRFTHGSERRGMCACACIALRITVDSTITYGSARREISLSLDRIRTSLDHLS